MDQSPELVSRAEIHHKQEVGGAAEELTEIQVYFLQKVGGRVGKCHGYDGYIRVKKLGSWGKKFGRPK